MKTTMRPTTQIRCGEVYLMDFGGAANEQHGLRPGIVFQNNVGNLHSPNIIALPLTTSLKKLGMPTHVLLRANDTGLMYDSMVLAECPKCIAKGSIGAYLTTIPDHLMREIATAHLAATAAAAYLDIPGLLNAREQALRLNATA